MIARYLQYATIVLRPATGLGSVGPRVHIDRWSRIDGYRENVHIGGGTRVDRHARLVTRTPTSTINLGADCKIRHNSVLDAKGGFIRLGQSCKIGVFSMLLGEGGLTVGDNVSIGPHCVLVSSNHIFDDPTTPIQHQGISAVGITLGSDIWLGAGVRVLDGVTINDGAVVAAGAVVNTDVPAFTVVGGVPARPIGSRG